MECCTGQWADTESTLDVNQIGETFNFDAFKGCFSEVSGSSPGESLAPAQRPPGARVDVDGAGLARVVGAHLALEPRGKRLQRPDERVVERRRGDRDRAAAPLNDRDRHCTPAAPERSRPTLPCQGDCRHGGNVLAIH